MNRYHAVKEITERLEKGLSELFESEKYKDYLKAMSKFHNYSFNNTLLIAMQKPDATLVAGFHTWESQFGRHVKSGEKAIRILAPAPYKKKIKSEGDTAADDAPKFESVINIMAFKPAYVFDISQTDGPGLPSLGANELQFSVANFNQFMDALSCISPVPIEFQTIKSGAKGYFSNTDHKIVIQNGMPEAQTVKTIIHEICHALLHNTDNFDSNDIEKKTRSSKEVEAESVAYTVCQHFNIDTSDYSFGYIAGWSSGKELNELKTSMILIRKTASKIINDIESSLTLKKGA